MPTRSTSTPRSTSSRHRDWDDPRSIAALLTAAERTSADAIRRCSGCATSRSTAATTTDPRLLEAADDGSGRRARGRATSTRERPRRARSASTSTSSASRGTDPFEAFDELIEQAFTWQGAAPYVRLDPCQQVRPRPAPAVPAADDRPAPLEAQLLEQMRPDQLVPAGRLLRGPRPRASTTPTTTAPATSGASPRSSTTSSGSGVDCLWLLPFYQSPLRDGGYDISDFFTVLPEYGDLGRRRRR